MTGSQLSAHQALPYMSETASPHLAAAGETGRVSHSLNMKNPNHTFKKKSF